MTRILVTGGAGALGRAVIGLLQRSSEYQVYSIAREVIEGSSHIQCDIRAKQELVTVLESTQPDVILHLAAAFPSDMDEAYAVNVEPAKNILDFIHREKRKTRVVLIGSAAEYGVVSPDENPIFENHVLAPISVYGMSKAWQTQLVALYDCCGVDVLCARVFNLYGAGVSGKLFAGRLQNQMTEVLAGRKASIELGALTAIRDYISTEEAATQLLTIATHGLSGQVYHIASGVPLTMQQFLLNQLDISGLSLSIVKSSPSHSNHSGYDVPVIYADVTKVNQLPHAKRNSV